jgi:hypothetical protein
MNDLSNSNVQASNDSRSEIFLPNRCIQQSIHLSLLRKLLALMRVSRLSLISRPLWVATICQFQECHRLLNSYCHETEGRQLLSNFSIQLAPCCPFPSLGSLLQEVLEGIMKIAQGSWQFRSMGDFHSAPRQLVDILRQTLKEGAIMPYGLMKRDCKFTNLFKGSQMNYT